MANEIRKLPGVEQRVETGPVQFGDDWPGVFIRGDNAFGYCMALDALLANPADPFATMMVKELRDTLSGSDLTGISKTPAGVQGGHGETSSREATDA